MRCPACGAFYKERSVRCPECGALQDETPLQLSQAVQPAPIETVEKIAPPEVRRPAPKSRVIRKKTAALLEFPGSNRSTVPEWRKELGERVREVQERKAREAILETGEIGPLFRELEPNSPRALEILPQAEVPPVNPLVIAALRRLERAKSETAGNTAVATAIAYEEQPESEIDLSPKEAEEIPTSKPERVHNLAVVPTPMSAANIPQLPEKPKPRRVIDERNDPALNYLDSIPTSVTLENREYRAAPIYLRALSALTDLAAACVLSAPLLALTGLTNLRLLNPRVIGFAAGTFIVLSFLYLTVTIAFTGRTIGMKLFSLRVVDARTGLIPTGSQSAGRALVYMLTLAFAGIALAYTFVDSEKYTVHDRLTRTSVIRV